MADDELIAFIRRHVDEDEAVALAATDGPWRVGDSGEVETVAQFGTPGYELPFMVTQDGEGLSPAVDETNATHIARWDPARVLAEVAAKRAILDLHCGGVSYPDECGLCNETLPCETVRALAQPLAGRDGWREEWAL